MKPYIVVVLTCAAAFGGTFLLATAFKRWWQR